MGGNGPVCASPSTLHAGSRNASPLPSCIRCRWGESGRRPAAGAKPTVCRRRGARGSTLAFEKHPLYFLIQFALRGIGTGTPQIPHDPPFRSEFPQVFPDGLPQPAFHSVSPDRLAQRPRRGESNLRTISVSRFPAKGNKAVAGDAEAGIVHLPELAGLQQLPFFRKVVSAGLLGLVMRGGSLSRRLPSACAGHARGGGPGSPGHSWSSYGREIRGSLPACDCSAETFSSALLLPKTLPRATPRLRTQRYPCVLRAQVPV